MEQEFRNKTMKSLCLYEDIYHIWLTMANQDVLDINVSDNVTNTSYVAAEFNGLKYTIKNERIFNDVVIKAMKQKPMLVKFMFQFYNQQTTQPDAIKDVKIKFKCFKRRVNIYIRKKTKDLLWD
jgi:hypothetical protein